MLINTYLSQWGDRNTILVVKYVHDIVHYHALVLYHISQD